MNLLNLRKKIILSFGGNLSYGPFRTKEGGETIAKFAKDDLIPIIRKIGELAVKTYQLKFNFLTRFYNKDLKKPEKELDDLSATFINYYHNWNTPDIFFKELNIGGDPEKISYVIQDYFNNKEAINEHFNQGFRLLDSISNTIRNQLNASYNRIAITISLIAIIIAIIFGIYHQ